MKALNRAIARTVSQLARHGREGCHPPMLMALENHLDALLTMERKQLEMAGAKFATLTGGGAVEVVVPNLSALLQSHANDNAQEPPSLPPSKWREGDALLCVSAGLSGFVKGSTYRIARITAAGRCAVIDHDGHESDITDLSPRHFKNYSRSEVAA